MAASQFHNRDLRTPLCSASAVPLVLPSNYEWIKSTGSVEKIRDTPDSDELELQPVQDALDILKTVTKPIAVLAICGPYRTGKSFFVSRFVGKSGTFKLGHSMDACTRGIWLSTTALECDEYVLLVLDTEGIGAVEGEGPESFTTKLLVATILLSSFLIYNSNDVPKQGDLQQMSSFAHLSTAINVSENSTNDPQEFQKYFPKFMWLLRDVTTPPFEEGEKDEIAALSKFLMTVVLTSTGQKDWDSVITSITTLFPQPILCNFLPYPNEEPEIVDLDQEENIDKFFAKQCHAIIGGIKSALAPKVGFDRQLPVTGADLAELAKLYIEAINEKGKVPSLESSWKAVVKLKLTKEAEDLVESYKEEMMTELSGNTPLEENIPEEDDETSNPTLMGLHQCIFRSKFEALKQKVRQILPKSSSSYSPSNEESPISTPPPEDKEMQDVLKKFESDIIVTGSSSGPVKSGILHTFITENHEKSEKHCEALWNKLEEDTEIEHNFAKALNKYDPKICHEVLIQLDNLKVEYHKGAIGPARESTFEIKNRKWADRESSLRCIPGPPTQVAVVGKSKDAMKLQWEKPIINTEAATSFIVEFRKAGTKSWMKDIETENQWRIVRNLKANTRYEFRVSSWNEEAEQTKKNIEEMLRKARLEGLKGGTRLGKMERAVLSTIGFLGGTAVAPLLATIGLPAMTIDPNKLASFDSRKAAEAAAACVTIPFFATLGAPIVGGTVAYHVLQATGETGDLEDRYVPRSSPDVTPESTPAPTPDTQSLASYSGPIFT